MFDEKTKEEILESVISDAARRAKQDIVLGSRNNLNHIAGLHSGRLAIYPSISKKFRLILGKPVILSALQWHEIRCVLCGSIVRYPCWYYSIRYAVNHFHYFVCFDSSSPEKPSTKCYRRDV